MFPIVLLTITVERRSIALNIRRQRWFRRGSLLALGSSLLGLGAAIVGVQLNGLEGLWAVIAWAAVGASIGPLAVTLIGLLATAEIEEDQLPPMPAGASVK